MSLRSLQALCLVNFFMADVRDGLGPFLGIFMTEHHWEPESIGWVMTSAGVASLLVTLPAGLAADAVRNKRQMLVTGTLTVILATIMLWYFPGPAVTVVSQVMTGLAAAFIAPLMTAMTLGLTGPEKFGHQTGRNEAFNHAGNMTAAVVAGASVWYWGTGAVFVLMTVMALLATACVMGIRERDVDNRLARGMNADSGNAALPRLSVLLREPALLIGGITVLLFHLGNAALLPMLSVRVAASPEAGINPGVFAAATVIISQAVMIPVALYAARRAQNTGYLPLITAALCILPIRAAVASLGNGIAFMPAIQILDGMAAGLLGVAVPGFVVRVLDGKGHTNAGQSFMLLMQGAGAALSPAMTGTLISHYSYSAAFAVMGAMAVLALIIWVGGQRASLLTTVVPESLSGQET
ncbi:MFS transporter [Pantoea sp. Acro-805]|uniref:MFS transporter n=1 Tax=Candidatus Pantoea formicae TaxID=2608355 RepID=A0ABX0QZS4_9GAMM|nr:MFS transporter [Pantoea formicae]MDF7649924.1 MFS transporter [Erwiniaceae bacterium L1_54_3]NIF02435.1 MFS transporter [Pantoea formicae]